MPSTRGGGKVGCSRREFLGSLAAAGAGSLVGCASLDAPASALRRQRPNILFLMTDDQRADALSVAGNPVVETPNMDRIAREGVRFTNAFVTNSLCAPSRACFLTGKYSHVHGVIDNRTAWTDQAIFPDVLRRAGYHTCFIGKCHQGASVLKGKFDLWLGFGGQGKYRNPALPDFDGKLKQETGHVTDLLTDRAVEYLRRHRRDPFCLCLWFKSPHRDWQPPARLAAAYRDKPVPEPPTFRTDYAGKPSAVRQTEMQVESAKGGVPWPEWVRDYYRTIAGVDEGVGRVLKALDELRLAESTVVVFTSDNGFFLGEHHFFDKRLMYEPSIRIPMLVRYPRGVPAGGRTIDAMCLNVDLAPTLLELARADAPGDMQGRSWAPLLEGRRADWRQSWYYEYFEYPAVHMVRPNRGVRTARWKYIEYPEFHGEQRGRKLDHPAEYELYDLAADPDEMHNLYGRPEHAAKVEELRKELARLRKELGAVA